MSVTNGSTTFKNKAEKLEQIKEEIIENSKNNNQREKNITLITSLVKYDTPFLVSSTISNKKTFLPEFLVWKEEDNNLCDKYNHQLKEVMDTAKQEIDIPDDYVE